MEESQGSGEKTAELLRVLNTIGFQSSILAMDAALNRREGAFAEAASEIRGLALEAAGHLAFPSDPAAPREQLAALTQSVNRLLHQLRNAAHPYPGTSNEPSYPREDGTAPPSISLRQQHKIPFNHDGERD